MKSFFLMALMLASFGAKAELSKRLQRLHHQLIKKHEKYLEKVKEGKIAEAVKEKEEPTLACHYNSIGAMISAQNLSCVDLNRKEKGISVLGLGISVDAASGKIFGYGPVPVDGTYGGDTGGFYFVFGKEEIHMYKRHSNGEVQFTLKGKGFGIGLEASACIIGIVTHEEAEEEVNLSL